MDNNFKKQMKMAIMMVILGVSVAGGLLLFVKFGQPGAEKNKNSQYVSRDVLESESQSALAQGTSQLQVGDSAGTHPVFIPDTENMWQYILTNEKVAVPDDYEIETKQLPDSQESVDARIYAPLVRMLEAMRSEGLSPVVCSGYRTKEKQEALFESEVQNQIRQGVPEAKAYDEAKKYVSVPNSGEHRLGLAVDIYAANYTQLNEGYEDTPEGRWLRTHAPSYGFILRYDRGKEAITGISYEPWHFRYVGEAAAQFITENNLCFEEFWETYICHTEK